MAEAKITLVTEAKDEGLQKLNHELAAGMQNVTAMKRQLKDMEAATRQGTAATKEQAEAMRKLRQEINEQTQANQQLSRAISSSVKEMEAAAKATASADAGAAGLAGKFKATEGFTTAFSVALGGLATTIMTGAVAALASLGEAVMSAGAQMQQSVSRLSAIKTVTGDATEAYRAFNDVYRNTTYDESSVQQMGIQLMTLGYSAQNAADMIQLCADTSAGLGKGQAEAQAMVDTISRMQATGEATSKQFVSLQMAGMDLDKAFGKIGMSAEEAMKAMDDGTLDAQTAIGALTDYMHEFDGSMAKSKDNVIDAWGDVTGNLQTMCAEIGMGIFDAFNQSEIIQDLIQFTQDLVDMVRGEGCGAFSDLKEVASFALDIIDGALNIVITTFKFIILTLDSAYEAFKSFGQQVYEALQPVIDGLLYIYDLVKSILSSIGKGFAGEVNKSWKQTFGKKTEIEPEDRASQNHFRTVKRSVKAPAAAKSGGGSRRSGGGSVKKELTEEEKAIEALIKKYSDADKQKWALAKSTVELAKVNMSMLTGEAKTQEEKRIKLLEIQNAHDQLLEGLNKELALAAKIGDETKRKSTLKSIQDQIDAENELYNAKVRAAEYSSNFANLQKQSQSILDQVFGNKDEAQQKIDELKQKLTQDLEEINAIMAQPTEAEQLTGFAALLGKTPEQFQADMEAQGTTFDAFVEKYKEGLAKAAEAEKNAITTAEQWKKKVCEYADQVGKSLGDAMADFILGEKGAKEALADFAKSIIQNAVRILAQWLGVFAIYSAFPMIASGMTPADAANKTVFGITKKATGGYITGPGTGTSDSIPAMLSNGEYVIRSAAVDAVGLSTLDAINAGRVPEFADGGSVDDTIAATTGGDSITLQLSAIDATSFAGFLDRGGLDKIKQALFEENRRFRSTSGVW
jgi:tape measure domain-containing protein